MRRMTWAQVCARRLARHALIEPSPELTSVVRGARPGDVRAELAIGLRVAGVTRADVRAALWTERTLVKTYGPRGTVHLFPARSWRCGAARWPPRRCSGRACRPRCG